MPRFRTTVGWAAALIAAMTLVLSYSQLAGKPGPREVRGPSASDTARKRRTTRRIPIRKDVPAPNVARWIEFPDAPPPASARYTLPDNLLSAGPVDTLGKVADRLMNALIRADVEEWAVYPFHKDGFAFVTRLEHIDPDGRPKPGPERWPSDKLHPSELSFSHFLKSLFVADPGYYRIIAIVVTSHAVSDTGAAATYEDIAVAPEGPQRLPPTMRDTKVGDLHATALIYQFRSPNPDSRPVLLRHSTAPPVNHLAAAGLWTRQQLTNRE